MLGPGTCHDLPSGQDPGGRAARLGRWLQVCVTITWRQGPGRRVALPRCWKQVYVTVLRLDRDRERELHHVGDGNRCIPQFQMWAGIKQKSHIHRCVTIPSLGKIQARDARHLNGEPTNVSPSPLWAGHRQETHVTLVLGPLICHNPTCGQRQGKRVT